MPGDLADLADAVEKADEFIARVSADAIERAARRLASDGHAGLSIAMGEVAENLAAARLALATAIAEANRRVTGPARR